MEPNNPHQIDVCSLTQSQEVTAYANGGLFPVLVATPDGALIAVLRGGAGHLGTEGRIEVIRSLDQGRTWSPGAVVADSERDDRNPALGVSRQGTVILAYHRQGNYDETGNYVHGEASDPARVEVMITRSHDGGLGWEEPAPLRVEPLTSASPFGKIVSLADGTLLLALYGKGSWIIRSQDDGKSWGEPSLIAPGTNETALLALPDGGLLAVLRGEDKDQALHVARSADGGHTWSAPVQITGPRQHPGDLLLLGNGDILLTYGNRNPPYRVEGRISRDGGRTWLDTLLTFSGHLYGYTATPRRATDLGYPSSALVDGMGVTLYYYNPSYNRPAGAEAALTRSQNPALYSASNYRAVALRWDEAALIAAVEEATG